MVVTNKRWAGNLKYVCYCGYMCREDIVEMLIHSKVAGETNVNEGKVASVSEKREPCCNAHILYFM